MDMSADKKSKVMSNIWRASHFEWRRAAQLCFPYADPKELVLKYWEEVGRDTATAYLKQLDLSKPLPAQLAENAVFSSVCIGAAARVVAGQDEHESFVQHDACPWYEWYQRMDLLEEDRVGCDQWFRFFVQGINEKLGTSLKFETLKTLPDGDDCCLRRFWVE